MIKFGTKAETLESIRGHLNCSSICQSFTFTVKEWEASRSKVLRNLTKAFPGAAVIIRSSAIAEDSAITAMAGLYDSILDVDTNSEPKLIDAISQVTASFARSRGDADPRDQVLVQPMILDISMSGVIFTQDLNSGAPYYVINYDDVSGKTNTVTSGSADNKTLLIHRDHVDKLQSPRFKSLMRAIQEIETITMSKGLDIEFAVTRQEEIFIFQVRRLVVQENWNREISRKVDIALNQVAAFVAPRFKKIGGVLGHKSIFTEMSDWNPAEMIGSTPRKLALSLYQYLITDSIWAEARAAMGYRDLSGRPLMVNLGGRPYIDVRESFNSFIPVELDSVIAEKLVFHWLSRLEEAPELHDKIEFEIATTVFPFDFETSTRPSLTKVGLNNREIDAFAHALKKLTCGIIHDQPMLALQVHHLDELRKRHAMTMAASRGGGNPLGYAKSLLIDCRRLGTRPFAVAARCGFIAEDMLRSLNRIGAISSDSASAFRSSVKTVLSEFLNDIHFFQSGKMTGADFFQRYGHLRPGTYNILSQRYDQRDDLLVRRESTQTNSFKSSSDNAAFSFSVAETAAVDEALVSAGFSFRSEELLKFMREAIALRELVKFEFSRNLSDALEIVASWGSSVGLNRDELSHLSIREILSLLAEAPQEPLEDRLRQVAKANSAQHEVAQSIRLPSLISDTIDIYIVPLLRTHPNLITQKTIRARTIFITGQELRPSGLSGRIVLIEGADPGFDWIFMYDIAGLITKYGGANSHMAIRCSELGIPAAIGCGEQLFERCAQASEITLDCGGSQILPAFN